MSSRCIFGSCFQSQESGQSPRESSSIDDNGTGELEQKLQTISTALAATELQLEQSQRQIQHLQEELGQVRKQLDVSRSAITASSSVPDPTAAREADDLRERVETLEAQVKLHDQTKVESNSKYPLRLTGLILFNSFINRGAVDNFDLPSIAVPQTLPVQATEVAERACVRQFLVSRDSGLESQAREPLRM